MAQQADQPLPSEEPADPPPARFEGVLDDWPELTWEDFERGSALARSLVQPE